MLNSPGTAFSSTVIIVWLPMIFLNSFGPRVENSADVITRKQDCFKLNVADSDSGMACSGLSRKFDSWAAETNSLSISTCWGN